MQMSHKPLLLFALLLFVAAPPARAADEDSSPADKEAAALFRQIQWTVGPAHVKLGSIAELDVPKGYRFADAEGAKLFQQATQNPSDGSELGIILPPINGSEVVWFVLFNYQDTGYIKDEEKNSLDESAASSILESIRTATEQDNTTRRSHGWTPITIQGWNQPPFYDPQTHHLTWAVSVGENGKTGVN
jgi:uncharacterized membrane-anchored protein